MKKIVLLAMLLTSSFVYAEESPWNQKLPFKEAAVTYKVDGMMKGSKTIYIRDYGKTTAEHADTSMSMFGMKQQQKEIIITTPDWIYSYDLVGKQGSKQLNPNKVFNEEFDKLSKADQQKVIENAEKTGLSSMEAMQGSVQKSAVKLLGYNCDISKAMGSEIYTIAGTGFPLKVVSQTMGVKYSEEAVSINKGKVSDDKFAHPAGIKAVHNTQADQMIRAQVKSVINQLRSGEMKAPQTQPMGVPDSGSQNELSDEQQQQLQKMMQMFGGGQ